MKRKRPYLVAYSILIIPVVFITSPDIRLASADDERISIEPRGASLRTTDSQTFHDAEFHASGDLVLVPVAVTDSRDRLVTGLAKGQFRLYEDKVEQAITHFASEDVPISIGVVFDCSGSMGAKLAKSRLAVSEFLKTANPQDEFALVQFNDTVHLAVGFTSDAGEIQNRLAFTQSKGRTALLDAIYLAMHEMKSAHHTRRALLIISDGGDNSSRYTIREIKNMVRESDVQIYAIGILEPFGNLVRSPEEFAGPDLLNEIAQQTGGRMFSVQDTSELPAIAARIGISLRNQYLLGYAPADMKKDGKYHHIQVRIVKQKGISGLRASFRAGYYAPGQ